MGIPLGSLSPACVLWTDGSSQECSLGWGAVLWQQPGVVQTLASGALLATVPGHGSEVAEWYAVAEGWRLIRARSKSVWLGSDCQSVVDFVNGIVENRTAN